MRSTIPPQTSIPLPVYYHSAEATYGTYRRRRPGNEAKDAEYYQVGFIFETDHSPIDL